MEWQSLSRGAYFETWDLYLEPATPKWCWPPAGQGFGSPVIYPNEDIGLTWRSEASGRACSICHPPEPVWNVTFEENSLLSWCSFQQCWEMLVLELGLFDGLWMPYFNVEVLTFVLTLIIRLRASMLDDCSFLFIFVSWTRKHLWSFKAALKFC